MLVNWFKQILKVYRFEATHQIGRICVLVHIENVKFLPNYFCDLLNSSRFTSAGLTH